MKSKMSLILTATFCLAGALQVPAQANSSASTVMARVIANGRQYTIHMSNGPIGVQVHSITWIPVNVKAPPRPALGITTAKNSPSAAAKSVASLQQLAPAAKQTTIGALGNPQSALGNHSTAFGALGNPQSALGNQPTAFGALGNPFQGQHLPNSAPYLPSTQGQHLPNSAPYLPSTQGQHLPNSAPYLPSTQGQHLPNSAPYLPSTQGQHLPNSSQYLPSTQGQHLPISSQSVPISTQTQHFPTPSHAANYPYGGTQHLPY